MATGASNADLAIVLVDARKGLLTQTRRHSIIVSLLGIRHVVLAVNKIDLVGFDETVFRDIVADYRKFAEPLGFRSLIADPDLGALRRQRLVAERAHALVSRARICSTISRRIEVEEDRRSAPFRLPVQWVNRPHLDFRGFAGTIPSGTRRARRRRSSSPAPAAQIDGRAHLVARPAKSTSAEAGDAVTLTLADEIDIARGDVLCAAREPARGRRPVHRAL